MKKSILLSFALILFTAPMADDVLIEGFEGGVVPPTGWDLWQEGDTGNQWDIFGYAHTGSYSASIDYTYADMDQWLVSPTLDLSGYENLDLSVWHITVDDSFYVYAGIMVSDVASPNAGDFVELGELGVTSGSWSEFTASMSGYDGDANVTIATRYTGNGGHIHTVDDFLLTGDPIVGIESSSLGEIKAIYR